MATWDIQKVTQFLPLQFSLSPSFPTLSLFPYKTLFQANICWHSHMTAMWSVTHNMCTRQTSHIHLFQVHVNESTFSQTTLTGFSFSTNCILFLWSDTIYYVVGSFPPLSNAPASVCAVSVSLDREHAWQDNKVAELCRFLTMATMLTCEQLAQWQWHTHWGGETQARTKKAKS